MTMALAACRGPPGRDRARGVTPARERRGRRGQGADESARRFAHGRITLEQAGEIGLPRLRVAGRRLPVPRHRGHGPGDRGGAGAGPSPTPRSLRPASPSGATGARRSARAVLRQMTLASPCATWVTEGALPTRGGVRRRGRNRRTSCCTSPPSRTRRACAPPTLAEWKDVNRRVPRLVDALPNGPHPTRARVPGRRRAGGDAAPARARAPRPHGARRHRRAARRHLQWWEGSERRRRLRERLREMDGIDPTTSSCPRGGAAARAHEHGQPSRQPRAAGAS